MTPAEHYAEAERILAGLAELGDQASELEAMSLGIAAQAHATLATYPPDMIDIERSNDVLRDTNRRQRERITRALDLLQSVDLPQDVAGPVITARAILKGN